VEVSGVFVAAVVLAASRLVPIDAKPASAVCACDFAVEQHCPSVLTIMRLYALSHKTFFVQPHLTNDISAFPMMIDFPRFNTTCSYSHTAITTPTQEELSKK